MRESATFDRNVIAEIQRAAREGIYDIRGWGAKRKAAALRRPALPRRERLPLPARGLPRALRHRRRARRPLRVQAAAPRHPDHDRRHELRRAVGARQGGARPRRDGDGHGDDDRRRRHDRGGARALRDARLPAPPLPLRHEPGRPAPLRRDRDRDRPGRQAGRRRDAARPEDLRPRGRACATSRSGIDQRSACRHPDWTGPDDLEIKIGELREITDWEKPVFVKIGASRTYYDVALAVKAGADVIVLDGMQGGTAATQEVFIEHVGIPILAAIPQAVESLQELGMHRRVQLVVSGGIRSGADVAKALALGADAVSIGVGRADRAGRQRARAGRRVRRARHRARASTTTGRPAATRPASRPRTTRWPRASTPCSAAAGWPTTCARSRSRPRRSRARAASRTCTTSSRRISSRSRSRRRRWRACRSPARAGCRAPAS